MAPKGTRQASQDENCPEDTKSRGDLGGEHDGRRGRGGGRRRGGSGKRAGSIEDGGYGGRDGHVLAASLTDGGKVDRGGDGEDGDGRCGSGSGSGSKSRRKRGSGGWSGRGRSTGLSGNMKERRGKQQTEGEYGSHREGMRGGHRGGSSERAVMDRDDLDR